MEVIVAAAVTYRCCLDEEQENMVKVYAKKHGISLCEAVEKLHCGGRLNLYKNSDEVDFCTEDILKVYQSQEEEQK